MNLVRICIVFMCLFFYFQGTLQQRNQRCRRTNKKPYKYCLNKQCRSNSDCGGNRLCLCDGDCGLSCVRNGTHCTLPKRSRNVRVKYTDGSNFGSVANFWCDGDEFKLKGSSKRVCRGIGKWDGKNTRCRIFCKSPKEIEYGNNDGDKKSYRSGSVVRYWCFRGYPMVGNNVLRCNNRGKWDRAPPKCIAPSCSKPILPDNAYIVGRRGKTKYKYNDMVRFRCEHGYYAAGTGVWRCEAKGWTKSIFRCIPRSCGDPGTPLNGKRIGYVFTFKRRVYFSCKKGYKLNGPEYRQCQSNQKWGDRTPTCEPIDCGRLPQPQDGEKIEETSTAFGGKVVFQCNREGYELKGAAQRICGENGKWSGNQTTCERVECKDLGIPTNGRRIPDKNKYVFEDKVYFKCKTNHTLMGNPFIICQKTKYWTGTIPRCLSPCTDPGIPIGGHRYGHSFRHDNVVRFSCDRNWKMEGTHTIRCNDGRWDHKTPKCLQGCARPAENQNNGNVYWSSRKKLYLNGEEVTFGCYDRYKLDGVQGITCRNGKWSNVPPSCKRNCYNPGRPANGGFRGIEFFEGKQLFFSCHSMYDLFGSQTLQCLPSGRWNASLPRCRKQCQSPNIPSNGATSIPSLNRGQRTIHGTTIRFSCRLGYTLEGQQSIRCEDGRWWGGVPVCKAPCSDPGNLQYGQNYGSNFLHGRTVRYTCLGMYILDGSSRMTCDDGRWDHPKPTCKKPCANPGLSLGNGIRQMGTDYRHGKKIDFTCLRGTRLVGESRLICNNGKWSSDIPVCREICPVLGKFLNGLIIKSKREYLSGDRVTFRCNPKYDLVPTAVTLYCDRGWWNDTIPHCFGQCKVPRDFNNVKTLPPVVAQEWLRHGSVLLFSCFNITRELDGRKQITCNNGKWSDEFPECKVPCIKDSGYIMDGIKIQSRFSVRYECNKGFTLEGKQNIACIDGRWSSGPPRCLRGCHVFQDNKRKKLDYYNHGDQHSVKCNAGFRLDGNSTITCNDGRWSHDIPSCIGVCRDLGIPSNGKRLENNFDYGARVRFRCNDEYDVVGSSELHCNDGRWSGKEPVCRARCNDPGTPTNGTRIGNRFNHSMVVSFSCNHGYTMSGTQSMRCSDGHWSGEIPTCSDCGSALGMEMRKIPDQNIRASSSRDPYHTAKEARLNDRSAWCSGSEMQPYLEIDFGKPYKINALATQGSIYYNKWVEAYGLGSNLAGSSFHTYREDSMERSFKGNRDSSTIVRQNLHSRLIARRIRIIPIKSGGYYDTPACMRVEIYGCDLPLDCVVVGSPVIARWYPNRRGGYVYLKGYMMSKTNRRVELENESHYGTYQHRIFPDYVSLTFVLDVPPMHEELQVGTRVLAPWDFRYYTGTIITPRNRYNNKYTVRADDNDWGFFAIDQIRLLKTPNFCK